MIKMIDTLVKAKQTLNESELCQDFYGIDTDGNAIDVQSPNCVAFCMNGTYLKALGRHTRIDDDNVLAMAEFLHVFQQATGIQSPACWNDEPGRTKAEVVEIYDKMIQWLKIESGLIAAPEG